jgi:hypothetical protein
LADFADFADFLEINLTERRGIFSGVCGVLSLKILKVGIGV